MIDVIVMYHSTSITMYMGLVTAAKACSPWARLYKMAILTFGCTPRPTKVFRYQIKPWHVWIMFRFVTTLRTCPFMVATTKYMIPLGYIYCFPACSSRPVKQIIWFRMLLHNCVNGLPFILTTFTVGFCICLSVNKLYK
jgi:hypothetical protein